MLRTHTPTQLTTHATATPHPITSTHASRNVVASGSLPECGEYCVEEEDDEEDGGPGAVLRRLVFLRNQHVIQSEIRLAPPKQPKQGKGKGKGKGGGGKKKGKKKKSGKSGGGRRKEKKEDKEGKVRRVDEEEDKRSESKTAHPVKYGNIDH